MRANVVTVTLYRKLVELNPPGLLLPSMISDHFSIARVPILSASFRIFFIVNFIVDKKMEKTYVLDICLSKKELKQTTYIFPHCNCSKIHSIPIKTGNRLEKEGGAWSGGTNGTRHEVDTCPRCMTLINREATRCNCSDSVNYARIIRSG